MTVPVIAGSQVTVQLLKDYYVCVVTARWPETEEATKQWLNTHFPYLTEYHHARTGTNMPLFIWDKMNTFIVMGLESIFQKQLILKKEKRDKRHKASS